MLQVSKWKATLVVLALILGVGFSLPNVLPASARDKMPAWLSQTLNLGLDLQGGSFLLMEADTGSLKKERLANLLEDVDTELSNGIKIANNVGLVGNALVVNVANAADMADATKRLERLVRPVSGGVRDIKVSTAGQTINLTYLDASTPAIAAEAMGKSVEIVRRRIDTMGTKEVSILRQGPNRILVQAPGVADPDKLKAIIGRTAKLTFQMVDESVPVERAEQGLIPPGSQLLTGDYGMKGQSTLVRKRVIISGEMLTKADFALDQTDGPVVSFRFNGVGSRKFGETTSQNVNRRFAIILDGKVISAPVIRQPIIGGQGQISGMTQQEATELSLLLKDGALPVKLDTIQQGAVGAELGADAVHAGMISTIVGFIAIVVFMMLAYGLVFGGVSVITLVVNLLLIFGFMSFSQSTLTLPGVAGLILTLAVAVDANVLIYERIRDEERAGSSPLLALENGFRRASVSILDANITSLIAGLIMMSQGSGPVKGFATMLVVGVFTSVFSAMLVSQVLLGFWFRLARPKQLPI